MKALAAFAFLSCVSLAAPAAVPGRVQFAGMVHLDGLTLLYVDQPPSKQAAALRLSDGFTLELVAPGNSASPDGALIRLLSPTGTVVHRAAIPDVGLVSTSLAYPVCTGGAAYMSPAPTAMSECEV